MTTIDGHHPCLMDAMGAVNERKRAAGAEPPDPDGSEELVAMDARLLLMGFEVDYLELGFALQAVTDTHRRALAELEAQGVTDTDALVGLAGVSFVEGLAVGMMLADLRAAGAAAKAREVDHG